MNSEQRVQALEVDVDTRLARVWDHVFGAERVTWEVIGSALRTAYAEGYMDALTEDKTGRRCALLREHGYAVI